MAKIIGIFLIVVVAAVIKFIFGSKIKAYNDYIEKMNNKHEKDESPYTRESINDKITEAEGNKSEVKNKQKGILLICSILLVIVIAVSSIAIVPTGHTGIKTTFGKVENTVLQSGFNIIAPWQDVVNMDNREHKSSFTLEAFSKDIQQVSVQSSINLNINKATAMNLYKNVGVDYLNIVVQPRVLEDIKIVIAKYTAENLIANRQNASDLIYELLKQELSDEGINVISFAIENLDFTDVFESAVEAKQVATQRKQEAQTQQEQKTMEETQAAERKRIAAQAEADVKKIAADAEAYAVEVQAKAKAEANKEIAATLSEPLIEYNKVEQWNGKLPLVSGESGAGIIDLRSLVEIDD